MVEIIACLKQGKVELLRGDASEPLVSPYQERRNARRPGELSARIVGLTRGRTNGELCYAISSENGTSVFSQTPGSREERRLFQAASARLTELDVSFGDEALACTVEGERGTSAIGLLADDGKGVRTVTEGDVVDRMPRWAPGGRGEIVYASAGVGRTKSGLWVGLSPSALHRLRFSDSSVEVLISDAKYDYLAPVPVGEALFYAIRRAYRAPRSPSLFALISSAFRRPSGEPPKTIARPPEGHELVRITPRGVEVITDNVFAFDVMANEDVVHSSSAGVFHTAKRGGKTERIAELASVERLVIC